MARVPDQDFEGFLNNLQDWELSVKNKDKKLKSHSDGKEKMDTSAQKHSVTNGSQFSGHGRPGQSKEKGSGSSQKIRVVGENRRTMEKSPSTDNSSITGQYDYLRNYDEISRLSSVFMTKDSSVDANSEKELGNEHFKQKKFKEAIDCYSRSIALSPTAVAYANRAMAYLKIKRFQDAEDDCTEALNLDDRYIKAFSRRSTARKELGKLKESIEDSEFALRLEPHNQEIKKQYSDAKSLYEKEILKKASVSSRGTAQKAGKLKVEMNGHNQGIQYVSSSSERTGVAVMPEDHTEGNNGQVLPKKFVEVENDSMITKKREVDASHEDASSQTSCLGSAKSNHKTSKEELKASVQELASRAAFLAKAEAAKSISPPNSAFQFEVSWRGLSGDRSLQARLLKATSPVALPQIFKNALSAPILIDIIRCITTFFIEEMDLAVKYLENLTKVSRFDMIIMCLSSTDKLDLVRTWDEVFCNKGTPPLYAEMLAKLRSRYCLKQ